MNAEGFARLAFEAHYDAEHPAGGGWDAWSAMMPDGDERAKWLKVGSLIEEVTRKAVRDAGRIGEDAPGSEPAKVIIVELKDHPARLFRATGWQVQTAAPEAGDLVLTADDEWVAQLGARQWDSVCDAEAILPADLYARHGKKLAIALDALREIEDEPHAGFSPGRATKALDDIRELDL